MTALSIMLLVYYTAVLGLICVYGLHRYWMVWVFLRHRGTMPGPGPAALFDELPRVTVQLPMFNERHVAERVIEAACAIDYPRDLLQVQVLDDSTDESADIARRCCEGLAASGHNVQYIHRDNRQGYKAGALANGLESAHGEFIVVFDADFVPPRDVILRAIHHFTDEQLGMVQLRWTHLNRHDSLLTEIQAMFLDGHFIIEQTARAASGRWFNFNGTAGVWRRSCIDDAGGWQHDTLTEDTDLSYRAQMKGWRFVYDPAVTCPAEVPPTVSAFLTQQHRWNKGLIQTAIKLLPRILTGPAPLKTKIEAWFHLTSPLVHVAIVMLALLAAPVLLLPWQAGGLGLSGPVAFILGTTLILLGTLAACTFYVASQWAQGMSVWHTIARLPALMSLGIGISVTNTRAVVEAVLGRHSPFLRTPKYNGAASSAADPLLGRRRLPAGTTELVLGVVMTVCLAAAFLRPHTLIGAPFMLLFATGYLGIGLPALRRGWEGRSLHRSSLTVLDSV